MDYVLEYLQEVEQGGISSLRYPVSNRGHVGFIPQDADDSVDPFFHSIRK